MTKRRVDLVAILVLALGWMFAPAPQHLAAQQESGQYHPIDGAVIYDHDPSTKVGDDIFGNVIADFENDAPNRCSHGGPVCMEYPNGDVVAFYANTSDHNLDGWSEYALSRDRGKTWSRYNKLPYSFEAYARDQRAPPSGSRRAWSRRGAPSSCSSPTSRSAESQPGSGWAPSRATTTGGPGATTKPWTASSSVIPAPRPCRAKPTT